MHAGFHRSEGGFFCFVFVLFFSLYSNAQSKATDKDKEKQAKLPSCFRDVMPSSGCGIVTASASLRQEDSTLCIVPFFFFF